MIRVWFNHWFSTSYRLIELMKQDKEEEIYVIGSNHVKESVIQNVCDEWHEEPRLSGEDYIRYCLDFCREKKVQVFVPRKNMVEISKNIERFHEIGVEVLVDAYDKISLLNDKVAAYKLFGECEEVHVPDYYLVTDAESFVLAYENLKKNHDEICFKFVQDEGGKSFRRIVENVDYFERLRIYPGAEVIYEELVEALSKQESFDSMMVMPYLPGDEISVDCLDTPNGLIAVPRIKSPVRHEEVVFDEKILEMTRQIMDKVKLEFPCNVQFKVKDNIPYLLEINTRMSGGLQMSCLAAGVNIPNVALNKLLGKNVEWTVSKEKKIVSYIEIPQIIEAG